MLASRFSDSDCPFHFREFAVEGSQRSVPFVESRMKNEAVGEAEPWFLLEEFQGVRNGFGVLEHQIAMV